MGCIPRIISETPKEKRYPFVKIMPGGSVARRLLDIHGTRTSLPQYREYIDNEDAQMVLMMDCLREEEMEARTCEKRQQRHSMAQL